MYTIVDGYSGEIMGWSPAEPPEQAVLDVIREATREDYEVLETHGPRWNQTPSRANDAGYGVQSIDDCAFVYLGELTSAPDLLDADHPARVAVIQVKKKRDAD